MSRKTVPRAYDLNARREREFRRQRSGRDEVYKREELDAFQPIMMTFKAFLSTQDDSITDEEALTKYSEYKLEFQRQQLNEFFVTHKEEEWFKVKYHPVARAKRESEVKETLMKRLTVFKSLLGDIKDVKMDENHQEQLVQLMDKVVVLLEGGTEEDLSRELHKTTSVFLNNLHPTITKAEIQEVASKFPGYLRVALSEPDPNNKFSRKCWISFNREAKIREICFSLNSRKIRDQELKAVVNKDLSKRIRTVETAVNDPQVMEANVEKAVEVVRTLDRRGGLYSEEGETNPLLENSELDKLMLYLRVVHSVDFFKVMEYHAEDEMPNRCGLLHVRPVSGQDMTEEEVSEYLQRITTKMDKFTEEKTQLNQEAASKIGLKNEDDEVEKFVMGSMQEMEHDKWLCTLSQKKFKAPEFVRKHITNKFAHKLDEVKTEVEFFNNYILDDKRPQQLQPLPSSFRRPMPTAEKRPAPDHPMDRSEDPQPPVKRSIKERLGNGGVRVTYGAKDPRDIVDYSDVDSFAFDLDY